MSYINPLIIEEHKLNIASLDVFSRLLMDRIVFLGVPIDDDVANIIIAQLLYLDSQTPADKDKTIKMYINTPGGYIHSGLAIYDTMQLISSPVETICTGMAASMGSILLAGGSKRSILPHGKVLIHQPLGECSGQASDILIEAEEIKKNRDILIDILAKHTNQTKEKLLKDMDRDYWMSAEEALNYGIIDYIYGNN